MSFFQTRKIYLSGTRKTRLDQARGRLILISTFFVLAYVIVVARAADLSLIQGELQKNQIEKISEPQKSASQSKVRTDIVDRNGVILARSLKVSSLYADPQMIEDPEKVAKDLHSIFPDMSYGSLLQKLQSKKRFVWIKRNIDPEQQSKVLYLGAPGLNFEDEMQRIYPHGSLISHMLGATGIDGQGLAGVEAGFNKYLEENKSPLELTLDVRIQHALKKEIDAALTKHKAKGGAGIIMDIESGEILAAVSLPDYDPAEYANASALEKFNQLTLGVYELGSTFKIFSTTALIEKNQSSIAQKFDVRNPIQIGKFKIKDYHPENRMLSLPEVFMHSSNIGSAMIGQEVGTEGLKSFYKDIGLLDVPEFEIPEMGAPLVPSPWTEINTLTASYGHGIAVSPLQLVKGVASIVNGGILVNPTIIAPKYNLDKETKKKELRVVSPQTSHRMRQLMRLVVTHGTGSKADVEGFLVGGKTGTAEKPGKGGYSTKKSLSSFLGVFPMDAPRYLVYVMLDEPQGTKDTFGYATGGWVAAPAVKKAISSMALIMGLTPSKENKNIEESLMRYVKTKEQLKKELEIETH